MGVSATKLDVNRCRIGMLIQMIFCSFFRQLVRPENWVKMGVLIGPGLSLIGPSGTPFLDIHSTSISEGWRVEFLGCFGLKIGA